MKPLLLSAQQREAILKKARERAMELRQFIRQEQVQGDLSPTDTVFLERLRDYLEKDLPADLGVSSHSKD